MSRSPVHLAAPVADAIDIGLTTTRAIRRRLDLERPVDPGLVAASLEIADQGPSGGAEQPVRWVVVADAENRRRVGEAYREAYREFNSARAAVSDERVRRVRDSSAHLAEIMPQVPLQVLVCTAAPPPSEPLGPEAAKFHASVYPSVWSFQVALRARGLGSCLTTIGLRRRAVMAEVLGLPSDWTQCALLPVAHITGTHVGPATRSSTEGTVRWT